MNERKNAYDFSWYMENCPECGGQLVRYEKYHDDPTELPTTVGRACLRCKFIQLDSMGKKVYGLEANGWNKPVIWSTSERKFIVVSKE